MHANGLGVSMDKKKARELYQKSADLDDTVLQNIIAKWNRLL